LFLFAAGALGGVIVGGGGAFGREVNVILTYEVDQSDKQNPNEVLTGLEMDHLIRVVSSRVNPSGTKEMTVRRGGAERIEVIIPKVEENEVDRIARIISRTGTLEFRILANNRDHKAIIERANKEPGGVIKGKTEEGREVIEAWWVPLYEGDKPADKKRVETLLAYREIAQRTVKEGGRDVKQVLVVKDPFDVNGGYLSRVTDGVDRYGKPCVNFALSAKGAKLFAGLTGANLPELGDRFTRKLGIILDGRVYSAPSIQSTIADRGEITGEFSRQEIEDLVTVLNAGALPAKLKLVEKTVLEEKRQ
jgi:SecD/SecF fusion protein